MQRNEHYDSENSGSSDELDNYFQYETSIDSSVITNDNVAALIDSLLPQTSSNPCSFFQKNAESKESEEKQKAREVRRRIRFMTAATNLSIFDGTRTLNRDAIYDISSRVAEYEGETLMLVQGNTNMVEVMKHGDKVIYFGKQMPIIIDPQHPTFDKYYQKFINKNKIQIDEMTEDTLVSMLKKIGKHVKHACRVNETEHDAKKEIQNHMLKKSKYQQTIYVGDNNRKVFGLKLEDIMKKAGANCSINALYTTLVMGRMIHEGKLPAGDIYMVRDEIEGGGHAWVCYRTGNKLFFVDPYFDDKPTILDLNLKKDRDAARDLIGKAAINTMIKRYRDADFQTISHQR